MEHLNILMVSSEMVPFAKTGGLADVVGTLPIYLGKQGHQVHVVIPKYSFIDFSNYSMKVSLEPMGVWMGNCEEWCTVIETEISENVTVYFVEHELYFGRPGLYHDDAMNDYLDNPRRFAFLNRAALQICKDLQIKIDVAHVHDWQSALVPAYLKTWEFADPFLSGAASVLTIHNAAYQGTYNPYHWEYIGISEEHFHSNCFETFGYINFLKGGIYFADLVNTVSPGYAREISTPYGGFGLAPYLSNKGNNFYGILNGVDYNVWSPEKDKLIPANYSADNLENKAICKKEIQKRFHLEEKPNVPILGVVGRLVDQKGYHLLAKVIHGILQNMEVQFIILGSGDSGLERFFGDLPKIYPGKAGSYIGFNNELAHLIEAGSDFFIMPSVYEPCGLNQMYSLKYGTLPIVRATGGLDDTVINYDEYSGEGTGFKFWDLKEDALYYTIGWAVSTYYDRPDHIQKLIKNAMAQDYSWEKSSDEYIQAYRKAIDNKKHYDSWYQI